MVPLRASRAVLASTALSLLYLDNCIRSGPSQLQFSLARFWWGPTVCKGSCKSHQHSSPHSMDSWLSSLSAVRSGGEEGRDGDLLRLGRMKNLHLLQIKRNHHERRQLHDF